MSSYIQYSYSYVVDYLIAHPYGKQVSRDSAHMSDSYMRVCCFM